MAGRPSPALVTTDMDATVRFWHGVLGARLVTTLGDAGLPPLLLRSRARQHDRLLRVRRSAAGHVLEACRRAVRARLAVRPPVHASAGRGRVAATSRPAQEPRVRGHRRRRSRLLRSIYFSDNNGIALEASWWVVDPTGRPVDYGDERLFADADPVPAVRELRETGQLDHTVATQLVDGIIEGIYPSTRSRSND